jgi:flagellar basal-body rod modification protein FlgD
MSVNSVLTSMQNDTAAINAEKAKERMGQSTLDQDSFLQLLMTQLQYQDPLNPMDNSQFLAQQAHLTQVSELQKMNQSSYFMQASNLIGTKVSFADPSNSSNTISGRITEATVSSKGTTVTVSQSSTDADGNVTTTDGKYLLTDVLKNSGNISVSY